MINQLLIIKAKLNLRLSEDLDDKLNNIFATKGFEFLSLLSGLDLGVQGQVLRPGGVDRLRCHGQVGGGHPEPQGIGNVVHRLDLSRGVEVVVGSPHDAVGRPGLGAGAVGVGVAKVVLAELVLGVVLGLGHRRGGRGGGHDGRGGSRNGGLDGLGINSIDKLNLIFTEN